MANTQELSRIASQVRRDIVRMVCAAKSGHPGGSLGITDVMTALYFNEMKHDPATWTRSAKGQDAFIISAGHLAPVYDALPGVFQSSGSLGQGLSCAAGIALGKKLDGESERVYCLLGDGESEEGQIWEAGMWAAHHKLDNLIAFTDWNGQQIDGPVEAVGGVGDLRDKWTAFGWDVIEADGHDFDSILKAFEFAHAADGKPKMILFRTEMGHGVDFMAGTHKWHGKAPNAEQCAEAMKQLEETLGDY